MITWKEIANKPREFKLRKTAYDACPNDERFSQNCRIGESKRAKRKRTVRSVVSHMVAGFQARILDCTRFDSLRSYASVQPRGERTLLRAIHVLGSSLELCTPTRRSPLYHLTFVQVVVRTVNISRIALVPNDICRFRIKPSENRVECVNGTLQDGTALAPKITPTYTLNTTSADVQGISFLYSKVCDNDTPPIRGTIIPLELEQYSFPSPN